jgi:hypothetical protein
MTEHGKNYATSEEYSTRKSHFLRMDAQIAMLNSI